METYNHFENAFPNFYFLYKTCQPTSMEMLETMALQNEIQNQLESFSC